MTRPVKFEGDGDLRGKAEIYDLHYPHEIDVYRQFPNTCYWLEENPQEFQFGGGFDQPAWQRDKPLTVGEFTLMYRGSPDEVAFFGGEETYRDLFKGHPSYLEALGELTRMQIEGYRYSGVAQISPWTTIGIYGLQWLAIDRPLRWPDLTSPGMKPPRALGFYSLTLNPGFDPQLPRKLPNPIYDQVRKAFAPLAVFIKEYDKNFYAGEAVERTYTVYNELLEDLDLTLAWAVRFRGKGIDSGRASFRLRAGYPQRGKIVFLAPSGIERREEFRLDLFLYQEGRLVHQEGKTYSVFPKARQIALSPEIKGLKVGVYDPRGDTARVLDGLGLAYRRMEDGKIGDFDLLIIGQQALDERLASLAGDWRRFVEQGGRIISLQQAKDSPLNWLPVDLAWAEGDSASSTITFPLAPGHHLLESLEENDLRFWRRDHRVSHTNFVKPSKGAFRVIVEAGGAGGLQYAPLLELPLGKGYYLLSQMDLVPKFAQEPAAALILRNLLK